MRRRICGKRARTRFLSWCQYSLTTRKPLRLHSLRRSDFPEKVFAKEKPYFLTNLAPERIGAMGKQAAPRTGAVRISGLRQCSAGRKAAYPPAGSMVTVRPSEANCST